MLIAIAFHLYTFTFHHSTMEFLSAGTSFLAQQKAAALP